MRTIAVIALKGGSGKTTVATHLALAAHLRGLQAMVADIDPQHSAADVLSARETPGPACVSVAGPKLLAAQIAAKGVGKDLLVVDTPAGSIEDLGEALVLADLALMVVRPTLLDLAGLARTLSIVRRLKKPSLVVLNQAPVAREKVEPPLVQRALRALDYMQAPVSPVVLRARSVYQTALERGRSAEEMSDRVASREMAALWTLVEATLWEKPAAGEQPASQAQDESAASR